MPILILKAPGLKTVGMKPRVGQFDYIKYAMEMAGHTSQVSVQLIDGTDHSFANRVGRDAVQREIGNWLKRHFPVAGLEAQDQGIVSPPIKRGAESSLVKPRRVSADAGCAMEGR
jgi:hypothetical protein